MFKKKKKIENIWIKYKTLKTHRFLKFLSYKYFNFEYSKMQIEYNLTHLLNSCQNIKKL